MSLMVRLYFEMCIAVSGGQYLRLEIGSVVYAICS